MAKSSELEVTSSNLKPKHKAPSVPYSDIPYLHCPPHSGRFSEHAYDFVGEMSILFHLHPTGWKSSIRLNRQIVIFFSPISLPLLWSQRHFKLNTITVPTLLPGQRRAGGFRLWVGRSTWLVPWNSEFYLVHGCYQGFFSSTIFPSLRRMAVQTSHFWAG